MNGLPDALMLVLLDALPLPSAAALCATQRGWWARLWCPDVLWAMRAESRLAGWLARAVITGGPLVGLGAPPLEDSSARARYRTLRYAGVKWLTPEYGYAVHMAANGTALGAITAHGGNDRYTWTCVDLMQGVRRTLNTLPAVCHVAELLCAVAAGNGRTLVACGGDVPGDEPDDDGFLARSVLRVYRLNASGDALLWHFDVHLVLGASACVSDDGLTVAYQNDVGVLFVVAWPSNAVADAEGIVMHTHVQVRERTAQSIYMFMSRSGRTLLEMGSNGKCMLTRLTRPPFVTPSSTVPFCPVNLPVFNRFMIAIDDDAMYMSNGQVFPFAAGEITSHNKYSTGLWSCYSTAVNGAYSVLAQYDSTGVILLCNGAANTDGSAVTRRVRTQPNAINHGSGDLDVCARGHHVMCNNYRLHYTHL